MTKEQEKQLLEAIYDRLFDAITYQPSGGKNPFTAAETFIHFSKNAALDVKSFENPRTPSNPTGDMKASETFARMVDKVSPMSLEWENRNDSLQKQYTDIVNGANAETQPDPKAVATYKKAYDYLHPLVKSKNPFTDEVVEEPTDSPDWLKYRTNMTAYTAAIKAYRGGYNNYLDDLESSDEKVKRQADRKWQQDEPTLSSAITTAQQNLSFGNAKYVEQALAILDTSVNDGIRQALMTAREAVKEDRQWASSLGSGKWLFAYPSPANWTSSRESATQLKISGGNTKLRSNSTEHSFSVDTGLNYGLFAVKASAEGKFEHKNSSTDKDTVEISCDITKVDINRPWFSESIFKLPNWKTNLAEKGKISNGKLDSTNATNLLPMYPVAFVVASNIVIKAAFSHEDQEIIKQSLSTSVSASYGPFSISGKYGYGRSQDNSNADFQNGEIRVPGMQIIGWVSRLIPSSPQM